MVILTQQSKAENECGISRALVYFHSFEGLNDAFEVQFFGASFLHLIKDTDNMKSRAVQIFKVEAWLNNAFKSKNCFSLITFHYFSEFSDFIVTSVVVPHVSCL